MQIKIPNIEENDYKDGSKLKTLVGPLGRSGRGTLIHRARYIHQQIEKTISEFGKIQEKIKPLKESIEPFEKYTEFELFSDIKKVVDAPSNLLNASDRIDRLGMEIRKTKVRLENPKKISGYLSVTYPILFSFKDPDSPSLDKIDDFKANILMNVAAIENMEGFIETGYRILKRRYVPGLGSDEILVELRAFSRHISEKTQKLKEELQNYIETLQSIQSIHKELKEIEEIVKTQGKVTNGTVISINCSTRIIDTTLLIYKYLRP